MSPDWTGSMGSEPRRFGADLALAHVLADAADALTRAAFVPGGSIDHEFKADGTPVSAVDLAVERALVAILERKRPGDAVLGEEVGSRGLSRRTWMLDGVDGTRSFVSGSPMWSTLIGLVDDGNPILGVKSSPAQGRRWWATRGSGAWGRDYDSSVAERLSVAGHPRGRRIRACVDLAWPGHPTRSTVDRIIGKVEAVAMTTHPAIMVATGDIDLAVQVAGGPYDFAGLMPIVWEAGGTCVDLHGHAVRSPQPPVIYHGGLDEDLLDDLLRT